MPADLFGELLAIAQLLFVSAGFPQSIQKRNGANENALRIA